MKLSSEEFYELIAALNDHAMQIKGVEMENNEEAIEFTDTITKKVHNYIFSELTDDEFYDGKFDVKIQIEKK